MKHILKIILPAAILIITQSCQKETNTERIEKGIAYKQLDSVLAYNQHILLDVNNDETVDFNMGSVLVMDNNKGHLVLYARGVTELGSKVMVQTNPELVIGGLWARPIDSATVISNTPLTGCNWSTFLEKGYILDVSEDAQQKYYDGLWLNRKNYYLAIRPVINGQPHYGWVRISHNAGEDKLTIHDFAYNKMANQSIAAGQTK